MFPHLLGDCIEGTSINGDFRLSGPPDGGDVRPRPSILGPFGPLAPCFAAILRLIRPIWPPDRRFWALCGRHRTSLEHNKAAHVVGQILHPDLHPGPHDADRAHELAAHAGVLTAEHMLNPRPH